MAIIGRDNTSKLAIAGLYSLVTFSLVSTVIVLQLYATRKVDTTISASLVLTLVSSELSLLFVFIHSLLALHHKRALVPESPRTSLNSTCRFLPRVLIVLWMATAAIGLIVAARQPRCVSDSTLPNFWQTGLSCKLHRAIVGMAVVAFVSICTVFCCIEVSARPYHASLFGISKPDRDDDTGLTPSASGLSWSSTASSDSRMREKLYHHRPIDLESLAPDRTLWLQRRNSHSSQSAIYPPALRNPSTGSISSPASLHCSRNPSISFSHIPYAPSQRSNSSSFTITSCPSTLSHIHAPLSPTRATSSVSSASRSTSSASIRKSPLSTMRRASEPDVPVIPARFLDPKRKSQLQRSPTLPCSWSPSLSHAPLSADPAIRALSAEKETSPERSAPRPAQAPGPSIRAVECVQTSQSSVGSPALPVRARGHSVPCNVVASKCSQESASGPSCARTHRPRISASPSSSTLHIPKVRCATTANRTTGGSGATVKPGAPSNDLTLADHKKGSISASSPEAKGQDIPEAQRMKKRWELARSKEARVYGMGSWAPFVDGNSQMLGVGTGEGHGERQRNKRNRGLHSTLLHIPQKALG